MPKPLLPPRRFLDRSQRLDRQAAFDVRVDEALRQPERDGKITLRQADGDLLAVTMDKKILLGEPLQELFAFGAHQVAPEPLTGARNARLEHADLAFPLRLQKIVEGSDLVGLDQSRVVKRRHREIRRERIDEAVGFHIVFPHMTAPPLLGIFDLGKNDEIHQRREHVFVLERFQRARAAVQRIEVFHAGFEFGYRSLGILCALRESNSSSMPKRLSKVSLNCLRNTAVGGPPATTLPSFFAASMIFFHSSGASAA